MSGEDLGTFVRDALGRGIPRAEIRSALLSAGWPEPQVAAALDGFADVAFPIPVPRPRLSVSAREAFEYLILFGTLYFAAFALGRLLFQFIDLGFPDPMWPAFRYESTMEAIRWSISTLVVTAPLFLFAARTNARRIQEAPVKRTSPVRRWLTYLTLGVTASLLIGDATSLVYSFLGGDLTVRFVLKSLTIAAISGSAFWYYLFDLRSAERELGS